MPLSHIDPNSNLYTVFFFQHIELEDKILICCLITHVMSFTSVTTEFCMICAQPGATHTFPSGHIESAGSSSTMVLILTNVTNDVFTDDDVKNNLEWKMTFGDTNNLILHVHVSHVIFVSSLSSFLPVKMEECDLLKERLQAITVRPFSF